MTMNMTLGTWIFLGLALLVVGAALAFYFRQNKLPDDWPIAARPVMTADEQVLYNRLRGVFPEFMVLAKVPLSRFMRLQSEKNASMWFRVLNPLHVNFVLCAANRRVVAAIDVETKNGRSEQAHLLKDKALRACSIRFVTFPYLEVWTDEQIRSSCLAPPSQASPRRGAAAAEASEFTESVFGAEQPQADAMRERLDSLRRQRQRQLRNASANDGAPDSFIRGSDSKM